MNKKLLFKKLLELADDKMLIQDCIRHTQNPEAKAIYNSTLLYIERKNINLLDRLYNYEDKLEEVYDK